MQTEFNDIFDRIWYTNSNGKCNYAFGCRTTFYLQQISLSLKNKNPIQGELVDAFFALDQTKGCIILPFNSEQWLF